MGDCALCEWLGFGALCFVAFKVLNALYETFYPFLLASPVGDLIAYSGGKWAVVTGSTDGIGKEYAVQLAKKGFNVAIVARNATKLQATHDEIKKAAPDAQVKQIVFDFCDADAASYEENVGALLKELHVGVLINNVGTSYEHPEYLAAVSLESARDVSVVNTVSVVMMTRLVLPQMVSRKRGVVVNVGSAAGLMAQPLLSAYSASKAFVDFFTRSLQGEVQGTNIFVQAVHPFFVVSKMSKLTRPTLFAPSPETYVRSCIRSIGLQARTHGYMPHAVQGAVISLVQSLLPEWLINKVAVKVLGGLRAKALRRKEKAQ